MKSVLLTILILTFTAGIVISETPDATQKQPRGFESPRVIKMRGGKFSRMFYSIITRANRLEIDQQQKKEVANIGREYSTKIIESENELRKLQMQFMQDLGGKNFNAGNLKTLASEMSKVDQKTADTFINSLEAIRNIIGAENYAKLTPVTKVDRSALIQLREEAAEKRMKMEEKSTDNSKPIDSSEKN